MWKGKDFFFWPRTHRSIPHSFRIYAKQKTKTKEGVFKSGKKHASVFTHPSLPDFYSSNPTMLLDQLYSPKLLSMVDCHPFLPPASHFLQSDAKGGAPHQMGEKKNPHDVREKNGVKKKGHGTLMLLPGILFLHPNLLFVVPNSNNAHNGYWIHTYRSRLVYLDVLSFSFSESTRSATSTSFRNNLSASSFSVELNDDEKRFIAV